MSSELKQIIVFSLNEIPELGAVLGELVEQLWPDDNDPWEEIRERTERLIDAKLDKKLDQDAYQRLTACLRGLRAVLAEYQNAIDLNLDPAKVYTNFVAARDNFDQQIPQFKEETHRLVLLPLFTQAANLQLALLRDGFLHGDTAMGMSADEKRYHRHALKSAIESHTKHATDTFLKARKATLYDMDPRSNFVRQMTIDVADYVDLWQYYDPDREPQTILPLTREVFSAQAGVRADLPSDPPGRGYYPPPPTTGHITRIWASRSPEVSMLESLRISYDGVEGPRMGGKKGKCSLDLSLSEARLGELSKIAVYSFEAIEDVVFYFVDGSKASATWRESSTRFSPSNIVIPEDHYLSSIHVVSKFNDHDRGMLYDDLVRTVWFGFRFKPDVFAVHAPQALRERELRRKHGMLRRRRARERASLEQS